MTGSSAGSSASGPRMELPNLVGAKYKYIGENNTDLVEIRRKVKVVGPLFTYNLSQIPLVHPQNIHLSDSHLFPHCKVMHKSF